MVRNILAVIAGYFVFAFSTLALFYFSGRNAHAAASLDFKIITLLYGVFFSMVGGYIAQGIANTKTLKINYALAIFMAAFAAFSYFTSEGEHWTQVMAIFVLAPCSILGGVLSLWGKKRRA